MNMVTRPAVLIGVCFLLGCVHTAPVPEVRRMDVGTPRPSDPAVYWNNATVYFLLTDRFQNGDPGNDRALGRAQDGALLRSFRAGISPACSGGWNRGTSTA